MMIEFINPKELLENFFSDQLKKDLLRVIKSWLQHGYYVCMPGCKPSRDL